MRGRAMVWLLIFVADRVQYGCLACAHNGFLAAMGVGWGKKQGQARRVGCSLARRVLKSGA